MSGEGAMNDSLAEARELLRIVNEGGMRANSTSWLRGAVHSLATTVIELQDILVAITTAAADMDLSCQQMMTVEDCDVAVARHVRHPERYERLPESEWCGACRLRVALALNADGGEQTWAGRER